jgi:HlyD family secretion protein
MRKVYIAQTTLVFTLAVGVIIAVPSFLSRVQNDARTGVVLVNGRIEGTEVAVGSKLPGRVSKVYAYEGQEVHAGDLLVQIEARDIEAGLDQVQASVVQTENNLENAKEQVFRAEEQLAKARIGLAMVKEQTQLGIQRAGSAVQEAEAAVDQARAMRDKVKTEFDHANKLQLKNAASDLELSFAKNTLAAHEAGLRMAQLRLEQAKDALSIAKSNTNEIRMQEHDLLVMESMVRQAKLGVDIAKAQLQATQASKRMIEIQLEDTKVVAPCDGMIVTRVVEPGEVISAGSTLMVAVDFNQLYLKGFLANSEYSQVKLNDPAKIYLDAFKDKIFDATVTKVNQQAEFTPKTVDTPQQRVKLVFGLELRVDNSSRLFKPGMPADAVIKSDPKAEWCTPKDLR